MGTLEVGQVWQKIGKGPGRAFRIYRVGPIYAHVANVSHPARPRMILTIFFSSPGARYRLVGVGAPPLIEKWW